jgi:hypothetical protein
MVSALRSDTVRTYAVNDGMWLIEGPVEREEADWRVHALDSIPQVFMVFVKTLAGLDVASTPY